MVVRYGTPKGTRLTLKGVLDASAAAVQQSGDVTIVLAGDAGPFASSQARAELFSPNRRGTSYLLRGSAGEAEGLTKVRFRQTRAGIWKVLAKGEAMSVGAPPRAMQMLLRIGDACFLGAPPIACDLSPSGRVLRCR